MNVVVNLEVKLKNNEETERLIKRFLKKMKKSKLMDEIREHDYYEKPSVIKKRERERSLRVIRRIQEEKEGKK